MTTEISDAARELYEWLYGHPHYPRWELVKRIEHALTAARNSALEDAAKACDRVMNNKEFNEPSARRTAGKCASEIRAMKVRP